MNPEFEVAFCEALWSHERDSLFDELQSKRASEARRQTPLSLAERNRRRHSLFKQGSR